MRCSRRFFWIIIVGFYLLVNRPERHMPPKNLQTDLQLRARSKSVFYSSVLRLAGFRDGSEKPKCCLILLKTMNFLLF